MGKKYVFKELELTNDPCFYQYLEQKELKEMNTIELTHHLKLARTEKRRLYDRTKYYKKAEAIDKENHKQVKVVIEWLEEELINKQGYFPMAIYDATLTKEIDKYAKCRAKYGSTKKERAYSDVEFVDSESKEMHQSYEKERKSKSVLSERELSYLEQVEENQDYRMENQFLL